jgi:hypothetical protein
MKLAAIFETFLDDEDDEDDEDEYDTIHGLQMACLAFYVELDFLCRHRDHHLFHHGMGGLGTS